MKRKLNFKWDRRIDWPHFVARKPGVEYTIIMDTGLGWECHVWYKPACDGGKIHFDWFGSFREAKAYCEKHWDKWGNNR